MKEEKQLSNSTILVELDALLDTRLSLLREMSEDNLERIDAVKYRKRCQDKFPGYNDEEFKKRYENRTKSLLKNAVLTDINFLLLEFCQKTLKNLATSPFQSKPKVVVNIYPYELNEDEIKVILLTVVEITNRLADVEIIRVSYEDLTVKYIKSQIAIAIMYDYGKWLEAQSINETFKTMTCPEVTLLGPAIYFGQLNTGIDIEHFAQFERLASPIIDLKLIDIKNFSFVAPNNIEDLPSSSQS